jgi:hypothetical protein
MRRRLVAACSTCSAGLSCTNKIVYAEPRLALPPHVRLRSCRPCRERPHRPCGRRASSFAALMGDHPLGVPLPLHRLPIHDDAPFALIFFTANELNRLRSAACADATLDRSPCMHLRIEPRAPSTSSASSMRARPNVRGKDRGTIMGYNLTFRDQSKNVRAARIYAGMISRER